MGGRFCEHVVLILKRNRLIKRRSRKEVAFELLYPLIQFFIVFAIKKSVPLTHHDETRATTSMPLIPPSILLYTPSGVPQVDAVMATAQRSFTGQTMNFTTADDMHAWYDQNQDSGKSIVGVTFDPTDVFKYSLSVDGSILPDPDTNFLSSASVAQRDDYLLSGFVGAQTIIDGAILQTTSGQPSNVSFVSRAFPRRSFADSSFSLGATQGLLLVSGFFPIVSKFLQHLVMEKEKRTKEGMKMMGLHPASLPIGWYLTYAFITFIPATILTVFAKILNFYQYTNVGWLFLVIVVYLQTLLMMAFLMTTLFDKAQTAGQVGGMSNLFLVLPSYALTSTTPTGAIFAACLSSPIAFSKALEAIDQAETAGVGLNSSNINGGPGVNFSFAYAMLMLMADFFIYGIIAFYLENAVQGEYGAAKNPCFCLMGKKKRRSSGTDSGQRSKEEPFLKGDKRHSDERKSGTPDHEKASVDLAAAHNGDAHPDGGGGSGGGSNGSGPGGSVPAHGEGVLVGNVSDVSDNNHEAIPNDLRGKEVVTIRGLTKIFNKKVFQSTGKTDKEVLAVDGISLNLYEGQILALLGHNGGGKSTTIGMLTGLFPPTSGQVTVDGSDLETGMDDIRQHMGVCPQHDILFDQLTVAEHLSFYAALKGVPAGEIAGAVDEKIHEIGLDEKRNAFSVSLSGGQKRKLSLGIALIGNPRIIYCDEPTSGMDPLSRRSVWDLLQRYKKGRCIVLTTHYMDEADLLGDRIAILSAGKLRCVGSSLFLKARFGLGYHLDVNLGGGDDTKEMAVKEMVSQLVKGSVMQQQSGRRASMHSENTPQSGPRKPQDQPTTLSFLLPLNQVDNFGELFRHIEQESEGLGVMNFGVSLTTLEEVFLNLAAEEAHRSGHNDEENDPDDVHGGGAGGGGGAPRPPKPNTSVVSLNSDHQGGAGAGGGAAGGDDDRSLFKDQVKALLVKRALVAKRNKRGLFFQFILPLVYIVLGIVLAKTGSNANVGKVITPTPRLTDTMSASNPYHDCLLAYSAATQPTLDQLAQFVSPPFGFQTQQLNTTVGLTGLDDYLLNPLVQACSALYGDGDLGAGSLKVTMMTNASMPHLLPSLVNAINNARIRLAASSASSSSAANSTLETTIKPFSYTVKPSAFDATSIFLSIFIGIAFSFIPVSFAVGMVREKEAGVKHMMFVMGVQNASFWVSYFIFDYLCYLFPVVITLVLCAAMGQDALLGSNFGATIIVLLLYGAAGIFQAYAASFPFKKTLTVQSVLPSATVFGTLICFVLTAQFNTNTHGVLVGLFSVILPQFALMWTISQLAIIKATQKICAIDPQCTKHSNIFAFTPDGGVGIPLVFLIISLIIYAILAFYFHNLERGGAQNGFRCSLRRPTGEGEDIGHPYKEGEREEEDVAVERARVARKEDRDIVVVDCIQKTYTSTVDDRAGGSKTVRKHAVAGVSFGVRPGEIFGLLGPNGAGKTTTLRMLTGDEAPSSGKAWLGRREVTSTEGLKDAFRIMGFCPQHDPIIDVLTGREHLRMYAKIKGVPDNEIEDRVQHYLTTLLFERHADKYAIKYSGGTKRKLCLAIALIGSPKAVLLDEPSTGMDPEARRGMWQVIAAHSPGRAQILTTHSMEEADALGTRLAIMVNGRMVCLGSSQHLKHKFGTGYQMEITTADDIAATKAVKDLVAELLGNSEYKILEEFAGRLRYSFAPPALKSTPDRVLLSSLFEGLQNNKQRCQIKDYSVSQTTLDQIFVNFARTQFDPSD